MPSHGSTDSNKNIFKSGQIIKAIAFIALFQFVSYIPYCIFLICIQLDVYMSEVVQDALLYGSLLIWMINPLADPYSILAV